MLSDVAIRTAKPGSKPIKLADERGLFLLLTPAGGKLWRLKYRINGVEKLLALGAYPDVGLRQARDRRDEARKLLAEGVDPGAARKAEKAASATRTANTFELVAREWHRAQSTNWTPAVAAKILSALERDAFPALGVIPAVELAAPEILAVLRKVESRGVTYSASRLNQTIGQIMRYAIATGRAERDPAADLKGALVVPKVTHMAAKTKPQDVADLLRTLDDYEGSRVTQVALKLAPMLFVRPGELRRMEWTEVDLDGARWTIPAAKMKQRRDHIVPLAAQAVALLRELQVITGHGQYVFASMVPGRPMSENTLNAALRRLGYDTKTEVTGHGFRAMARTLLHEELGFAPEVIEHQLAHRVPDALGAAYNRTQFMAERVRMMQRWANYLDRLKAGAEVIQLRAG